MKKFVLIATGLLASFLTVQAQTFFPTNLVVVRIGGSGQTLANTGNTFNLDQYTTSGTLVSSLTIPDSGTNPLITAGGSSPTEGLDSLSLDGRYIVLCGYATNRGGVSTSISGTAGTVVSRGIATVDAYGNYSLPVAANIFSGGNIRSAASDGLGNFWAVGSITGIIYAGNNGPIATVSSTVSNGRGVGVFDSNLWVSTGAGSLGHGVFKVTGLPTTTGNTAVLTLTNGAADPMGYAINSTLGIAYVAGYDNPTAGGGIARYSYNGSGWVSNYTIAFASGGADSVVADWSQNPPVLYAITGNSSAGTVNSLVIITDTGAGATATVLATAPTGQAFRGLTWGPVASPRISTQPSPVTVAAGQTATFTVGAYGSSPLTYIWYTNSTIDPDSVTSNLGIVNTTLAQNNTQVYVVVSNSFGSVQSSNATLTVSTPGSPTAIAVTPGSETVNAGSQVIYNASFVGGVTSLTYTWTLNGTKLNDGSLGGSTITGSSSSALTIDNALAADDGSYVVLITNSLGNGNNSASPSVLTVTDPVLLSGLTGATNFPGGASVPLSISAAGSGLTYEWLSNGVVLSGVTTSSYTVPSSSVPVSTIYSVIVSNSLGMSLTNSASVVYSAYLLNEPFSYTNGNLFTVTGSPWTDINGTNVEAVTSGRTVINQTNATTDAQDLFSQPVTNTILWASFTINLSTLPTNSGGTYFGAFDDTNFGFYARIFTLTTNKSSLTPGFPTAAYPGTYRLGIANEANDFNGASTNGPGAVVELDMAPGIDYQVVEYYDLANGFCGLSVNPDPAQPSEVYNASTGPIASGFPGDTFTASLYPMAGYVLRQRQGEGVLQVDNLKASYDYGAQYSGYAIVMSGVTPSSPVIGLQPVGTTNYAGNTYTMAVAASGIPASSSGLTYAWYQNGSQISDNASFTGTSTPVLTLNSISSGNVGSYYAIVTGNGSTQSASTMVALAAPSAPYFVTPTNNTNISVGLGANVSFAALAQGTLPITYLWYKNGSSTGVTTSTFSLSGVTTNDSGTYYAVATGGVSPTATSSNFVLTVVPPVATNIGYLRSLLTTTVSNTTVTVSASDTTTIFSITGVVTVANTLTSGEESIYVQDSTGGINFFVNDTSFQPALGDIVTVSGTLDVYNNGLEVYGTANSPSEPYSIISHNATLPTPIVLPFGFATNNIPYTVQNITGSLVTLTNMYFSAYAGTNVFVGNTSYTVTNKAGQSYIVYINTTCTNVVGTPIPQFAYAVTGPLVLYNSGFEIEPTYAAEIVAAAPPAVQIAATASTVAGTNLVTLKWTAVPDYTYSVLFSTNVSGPYSNLASGLVFSTTNGTYSDNPATTKFYQIVSP